MGRRTTYRFKRNISGKWKNTLTRKWPDGKKKHKSSATCAHEEALYLQQYTYYNLYNYNIQNNIKSLCEWVTHSLIDYRDRDLNRSYRDMKCMNKISSRFTKKHRKMHLGLAYHLPFAVRSVILSFHPISLFPRVESRADSLVTWCYRTKTTYLIS